ncbi:MAG: (Fe-S)-binding protein, partial [Phycisphaerales bacterium]
LVVHREAVGEQDDRRRPRRCTAPPPRVGQAAIELLESFGYRVELPQLGCCGRSRISTGMVAAASRECRATAEALMAAVDRTGAVAVVGCEPSCMSAIRDDWLELRMGVDRVRLRALAGTSFLVEEFLERRWDAHPARPAKPAFEPGRIALHAHCHQKALWGAESSAAILRRYFGADLEVLATGCCGMAGSFGFTQERYDLSMRIGELGVLPAVRARADATVCAPGTSCRHQIHDGAGREALHPVEVLQEREVLLRDLVDRDVGDVDLGAADEEQEEVKRPLEAVEPHLVVVLQRHAR